MKEKFAKLIDVKSIVTIILTAVFSYLAVKGEITGEQFLMIFTTVIAFYFGTQYQKKVGE
jgi:mannose/fructose/N-acetylgalactosamine-specific phosphotransferase system component IID